MKFGLIPEFVGRLPVIGKLMPLNRDALVRILKEPKNSLVKQYQSLFAMDHIELEFEDSALEDIAETAMKRNTGARGLRAIMEDFMGDLMFDLPSRSDVKKVIINKAFTSGSGEPVLILRDPQEIKDLAEQANHAAVHIVGDSNTSA